MVSVSKQLNSSRFPNIQTHRFSECFSSETVLIRFVLPNSRYSESSHFTLSHSTQQREEDLDTIFNEHDEYDFDGKKLSKKQRKRREKKRKKREKRKRKKRRKKRKKSKRKSDSKYNDNESSEESQSEKDENTSSHSTDSDSDRDEEEHSENSTSSDSDSSSSSDSDSDSQEDDDSDTDNTSESDVSSNDDDGDLDKNEMAKWSVKRHKEWEKSLAPLLNGNVEEYLSKHLPMAIPAMSPRNSGSNDIPKRIQRELGPIHTNALNANLDEMKRSETVIRKDNGSDDDDINGNGNANGNGNGVDVEPSPEDNAKVLGQSRNRKLDRILRGSKSDIEYTKKVRF